jgi:long-subunit fatty acid transport protein
VKGFALLAGLQVLVAAPALGITDEEIFRDLRFNFINPGGRSLGMGGAFIALADDATAAQANPSGLATLLSQQLFVEIRYADTDPITTSQVFRDPIDPDTGFDVLVETEPEAILSPSFISYVLPKDRWSVAFSRQEVIHIENTANSTYEFFFGSESDIRSAAGTIDLELVNWNVSAAYRVHEKLRLGATVSLGALDMRSEVVNSYVDPTGNLIGDPGLAGVPFEMYRTTSDGTDQDVTFTLGLLWSAAKRLTVGASYRRGGDFGVAETLRANPIDTDLVPGMISSQVFFNETDTLLTPANDTTTFVNAIHVPDVVGVGLSGQPVPRLTLSLDGVHLEYSDLTEGFNSRLNVLTAGFETEEAAAFTIDDQTNLHLGAEYLLRAQPARTQVLLRGGAHQDKDNRLRSDFAPGGFGLGSNDTFPGRDDVTHYSVGLGIVAGNHFQLDTAVDFSELGTEGVLSWIYKF